MTSPILLLTAFAFCVGLPMDTKAQQSIPDAPVLQTPLYIPPSVAVQLLFCKLVEGSFIELRKFWRISVVSC